MAYDNIADRCHIVSFAEQAKTDVDLAMKLAMAYWKMKDVNKYCDKVDDTSILNVSIMVNGGQIGKTKSNDVNGYTARENNTNNASKFLSYEEN